MQNTVINFKTEEKIKKESPKILKRKKMKIFDVTAGKMIEVIPTQYFLDSLKESEEDEKAGRVTTFKSKEEELEYLDKEIEDERRKFSSR